MKISIIGLGLMGGSFAKALRKYSLASKIYGFDHNIQHQEEALRLNLVDKIVSFKKIKKSDLIILAVPVDSVVAILQDLQDVKNKTTICDLGSTKLNIIKSIPAKIRKNFVAMHPMTGTENFGPKAAIDNLYENRVSVLCNLEDSGKLHKKRIIKILETLNMKIIKMSAIEHDKHTSFISHLPHIISYSLANTVMKQEEKKNILNLAAGGFRDMSRIAKSSPNMWCDIFKQNRENLLNSINLFEKELKILKNNLKDENWEIIKSELKYANKLQNIFS